VRFIASGTRLFADSLKFCPSITSSATCIPVFTALANIFLPCVFTKGSTSRRNKPPKMLPRPCMTALKFSTDKNGYLPTILTRVVVYVQFPASVTTISCVLYLVIVQSTNDTNRLLHSLYIGSYG